MNTKIIRTLVKKEMLDVFRDKKTMIMMVLVPVILYPLIFVGAMQFMSFISSSMETQNYRIAVDAKDGDAFIHKLTEQPAGEERSRKETEIITIVDAAAVPDYETALNEESIDVYVSGQLREGKMQYDVYYLSSVTNSAYAANIVMEAFDELKEEMTRQKIQEAGMDLHEILEPIAYEKKDTASNEQSLGSIMGSILPFMLICNRYDGRRTGAGNAGNDPDTARYEQTVNCIEVYYGSFNRYDFSTPEYPVHGRYCAVYVCDHGYADGYGNF